MSSGSIDIDEFENTDVDDLNERTDTERIVVFLDEHDDRAWKASTIASRLDLETDTVSAILSRLKTADLCDTSGRTGRSRTTTKDSKMPTSSTTTTTLRTSSMASKLSKHS